MDERIYLMFNNCYGGFSFSKGFCEELGKRLNTKIGMHDDKYRDNQEACKLLMEKGSKWCGNRCTNLQLVSIPKYMSDAYAVSEYDGLEGIYIIKGNAIAAETRTYIKNRSDEAFEKLKNYIDMVDKATVEDVEVPE